MDWNKPLWRRLAFVVAVVPGILIITGPLAAQRVKSSLSGLVSDPSGAAVPGATVVLTNEGTNSSVKFETGADGIFNFPFLDPGNYGLKATASGFKVLDRTGIIVRVNTDERVDLKLEVGAVTEKVSVTGISPLLETVNSTLGQTVATKAIEDLPLNGRNIYSLLNILPGSSLGGPSGAGITATDPMIDGQNARGNNFTLDGVSINQEHSGFTAGAGVALTPDLDAISEFKVVTNDYSAEYGRSLSAVISMSIKSGSNQFHGTGFDFLRNDLLNARTYFLKSATAPKPVLRYNQFGFSVGGPIRKNKLFFFEDAEWLRNLGQALTTATVPTAAMRQGDFSTDANTIYDPGTTSVSPSGVISRTAFNGNVIPNNRIDTIASKIIAFWPLPNLPGTSANFTNISQTSTKQVRTDTRIDYNLRTGDTISGRFSYTDPTSIGSTSIPGAGNPSATRYQRTTTPGFQVNETHIFSPRVVNELRAGFQREHYYILGDPAAAADWRTQFGMPLLFGDPKLQLGFPYTNISGVTALGTPYDFFLFVTQVLQFNDMLSWSKGKHFLKLGGSFSHISADDRIPNFPAGGYYFTGQFTSLPGTSKTGRGFADFLLSDSSTAYAGFLFGGGFIPKHNEVAGFVQDDYRIRPKLTLNLGLRYDVASVIHTDAGNIWNYNPSSNLMVKYDPPGPIDWKDIAPRLGFTYAISSNTVLRGGYGTSYLSQWKGLGGFLVNPPVLQQHAYNTTDGVTPARTLEQNFGTFETSALSSLLGDPSLSVEMFIPGEDSSPYVQSWNLTLQRQLGNNIVVTASYVGNKGTHIGIDTANLNQLPANQLGPDSQFGGVPVQQRVRFPNVGLIQELANDLNTNYHALQVKVEFRNWHGLSALTSYTHGKTLGVEEYGYIQEAYNRNGSYGLADADLPNVIVQSFGYELPFGQGKRWGRRGGIANQIVGGWHVNGIFTARSGYPINLTSSVDQTGSNGGMAVRPNQTCNGTLPASQRSIQLWFNTGCYSIPAPYKFGNAAVFSIRGPGMVNLDASAFKRFRVREGVAIEFRAEAFNFTNTPGFGNPNGSIGTTSAGRITGLLNANRTLQGGLKVLF